MAIGCHSGSYRALNLGARTLVPQLPIFVVSFKNAIWNLKFRNLKTLSCGNCSADNQNQTLPTSLSVTSFLSFSKLTQEILYYGMHSV